MIPQRLQDVFDKHLAEAKRAAAARQFVSLYSNRAAAYEELLRFIREGLIAPEDTNEAINKFFELKFHYPPDEEER